MNPAALTEKQLSEITGKTVDDIRSFVRAGMTKNPDGTFSLAACIAWKLINDRKKDI